MDWAPRLRTLRKVALEEQVEADGCGQNRFGIPQFGW